jgi:hypothetical protein
MKTITLLLILIVGGCAASAPVQSFAPVVSSADDLSRLAGVWNGRIESPDPRFAGDVTLSFDPEGAAITTSGDPKARVLWVRLVGTRLTGALAPFFDETRAADVYMTFDATVTGDEIRGVLRERVKMEWSNVGTWTVRRMKE